MNSPNEDDPDFDLEEMFFRERIALADARAKVAFCEYELARLAKEHPETAARMPPLEEHTLADLRTNELNDALGRINAALGLTGEEQDYWLTLWDYARANRWVEEDEFDDLSREKLTEIIAARLQSVHAVKSAESAAEQAEANSGSAKDSAVQMPALPNQQRNSWARSGSSQAENLYASVRRMKDEGLSQLKMCERLDAQKSRRPDLVGWRNLTWRAAYLSPEYKGAVKKWLSKVTAVTP